MCNPKMTSLLYNPKTNVCNCIDDACTIEKAVCNNGIRELGEECDNGKNLGCSSGCVRDLGFICSGDIGTKSICNPICGDRIRT
jgi:hypothetical protein